MSCILHHDFSWFVVKDQKQIETVSKEGLLFLVLF